MSKIKGITIWEQYVEFMVLGITAVLLLVFAALQFIGNPNAVEVAQTGTVGPREVDSMLAEEAARINAMLDADADPRVQLDPPEPIAPVFEQRLVQGISPASTLPQFFTHVPPGTGEPPTRDTLFTVPEVPAPSKVVSRQYFDGLLEETVQQHEELQARFSSPPYDISWVTVAAKMDMRQIIESYNRGGPDGEPAPLPQSWHNDRPLIVDIRAQRQTMINGEWVNDQLVDVFPGQASVRREVEEGIETSQRETFLRWLRDPVHQQSIVQPEFFPTKNNAWFAPDPDAVDLEGDVPVERKVQYLQRRIVQLQEDREATERELATLRGSDGSPPPRPPSPGRPGGGGRPTPPGSGGQPGGGPVGVDPSGNVSGDDQQRDRPQLIRIRQLEDRLRRLESDLRRAESELQQLDPDGTITAGASAAEDGAETLWVHDLNVEPGYTYRYQLVVEVYNPLFGRRLNLVEEQQPLADRFVLRSKASPWSDPIEVKRPVHLFVARADAPELRRRDGAMGGPSVGQAVFEVYRFYDGRWWESRFTVEPGERVGAPREVGSGATAQLVDYSTDWFVLDILPAFGEEDSARVVLQHVNSAEVIEVRQPASDADHPLRRRLREEMQLASGS